MGFLKSLFTPVNKITDAIGLTDYEGQEKARQAANKAAERNYKLAKTNLEFNQNQYNDWKEVYGDLQANLGDYYNKLGPDRVISLELRELQTAYQKASEDITASMAKRGLEGSKFEAYAQTTADIQNANRRAEIRSSAEDKIAKEKLGFLGVGLGQGTQLLGNVNVASNTATNAGNAKTNVFNSQFGMYTNNNAAMMRLLAGEAAGAAGAGAGAGG